MFSHTRAVFACWLVVTPLCGQQIAAGTDAAGAPEPIRLASTAFDATVEIEVRDLPADLAESTIQAALTEIYDLGRLSDPDGADPGGVGALNRAAGKGPQAVDPRIAELLLRSLQFCIWSNGAYGPLGGDLYELWRELRKGDQRPAPSDLRRGVGSAECGRLSLRGDRTAGNAVATAELDATSRVDLRGIARGFAVDRAGELLQEAGSRNFWIEIGNVLAARGGGPDGRGWLTALPPAPGEEDPIDRLWLRDQALAMISIKPIRGEAHEVPVDQRSGMPAQGVVSVFAVTELAVDAEPLVNALFVLGHREGHMRLGSLNPRPSVYWLLGQGLGTPLESTYHWSDLDRIWRR